MKDLMYMKADNNSEDTVNPEENVNNDAPAHPEQNNDRPNEENSLGSIREIHNVFVDVLNVLRERGEQKMKISYPNITFERSVFSEFPKNSDYFVTYKVAQSQKMENFLIDRLK